MELSQMNLSLNILARFIYRIVGLKNKT